MSKLTKRITAMILAGMLVIGAVPGSVFAADANPGQTSEYAEELFTEEEAAEESSEAADAGAEMAEEEVAEASEGNVADTSEEAAVQYYTVTLDANGGYFENEWDDSTGEIVEQAEVVEKHVPVDGTVATFPVFKDLNGQTMVFAGWSLERDGELVITGDEEYAPVDNCVLYAVWAAAEAEDVGVADTERETEAVEETESAQEYEEAETGESAQESEVTEAEEDTNATQETAEDEYAAPETNNEQDTTPAREVINSDEDEVETSEEAVDASVVESSEEEETLREDAANGVVESGKCGENLTWTLDEEGILTISGTGEMVNYGSGAIPTVPEGPFSRNALIKTVIVEYGVTSIGSNAFLKCANLTNVIIANSVTRIFSQAFKSCSNLKSITIPDSVTRIYTNAFADCTSLSNIVIPNSVTEIDYEAFRSCSNLKSITIPDRVTIIQTNTFGGCSNLTSITIPSGVTTIEGWAFQDCTSLTSISIPKSVTSVGLYALSGCTSLSTIYFNGNAPTIASDTFNNVTATAYYPANDPTWTEDVRQNYGGNITWVEWDGADPIVSPNPPSFSLNISTPVIIGEEGMPSALAYYDFNSQDTALDEAKNIKWTCSDPNALVIYDPAYELDSDYVSISLLIRGKKPGSFTITGTAQDGRKASAGVAVEPEIVAVSDMVTITETADVAMFKATLKSGDKGYLTNFLNNITCEGEFTGNNGVIEYACNRRVEISDDGKSGILFCTLNPNDGGRYNFTFTSPGGQQVNSTIYTDVAQYEFKVDDNFVYTDEEWGSYVIELGGTVKYLTNPNNFYHVQYISDNDNSIFGEFEYKFTNYIKLRDGWRELLRGELSVDCAEEILFALMTENADETTAISDVKSLEEYTSILNQALELELDKAGHSLYTASGLKEYLTSEQFEDAIKTEGFEKSFKGALDRINGLNDSERASIFYKFKKSGSLQKGLDKMGFGLEIINVTNTTLDQYFKIIKVKNANELYMEMLEYIKDNARYEAVKTAASNLITIQKQSETEALLEYGKNAIGYEVSDKMIDEIVDHIWILKGAKFGFEAGDLLSNKWFHTQDIADQKSVMRMSAYIGEALSSWIKELSHDSMISKNNYSKAEKAVNALELLYKIRLHGENALKEMSSFLWDKSSEEAAAKAVDIVEIMSIGITMLKNYHLELLKVACPVNVEVYDSNDNLVCTIYDGKEYSGKIEDIQFSTYYSSITDEYVKIIMIPEGSGYYYNIIGNDLGITNCELTRLDDEGIISSVFVNNIKTDNNTKIIITPSDTLEQSQYCIMNLNNFEEKGKLTPIFDDGSGDYGDNFRDGCTLTKIHMSSEANANGIEIELDDNMYFVQEGDDLSIDVTIKTDKPRVEGQNEYIGCLEHISNGKWNRLASLDIEGGITKYAFKWNNIEYGATGVETFAVSIFSRDDLSQENALQSRTILVYVSKDPNGIVDSGICGDSLTWSLDNSGVLTISGNGAMTDFPYMVAPPWYGNKVIEVVIGEGVTSIGDYAFCNSTMRSISLPESLQTIGNAAFYGCTGVESFHIPAGVVSIDHGAFAGSSYNSKLNSITVEDDNTVYSSIDGVVYSRNGKTLEAYPSGRDGHFSIPKEVQEIGYSAFSGCKKLTGISIPENVTEIGDIAFALTGLSEVAIPSSVDYIGERAFINCRRLEKVIIEAPISTLKSKTFSGCPKLETIYLPESLLKIEKFAFFDCISLNDNYFAGSESTWGKVVIEQGQNDDTCITNATVHFAKENEPIVLEVVNTSIEVSDQFWTGEPLTPIVYVKYLDDELTESVDYTLSYSNNTKVGTATVKITGKGNYTGTISKTFKINGIPVSNATVSGISNKTYTGSAITQDPIVKIGDKTLTKNTDYTVSYQNNTNVGTATVTITGKGNYASKKNVTFKINKAAQSITAKAGASRVVAGKTTTVSITGNKGKKSYKSSNTAIATVDSSTGKVTAKKVGTVKITATSAATSNYNAASKTVTIKIVPAATASLTAANQATGIKLTWKKVTGANGYKIYRGSTLIKTITSGNTVTFADTKANTNGTKYTYKVLAKATTGDSTLSKSRVIYRVSRPAVSSVTNSASKKMTVKWGKNAKANGYQIQYSTDKTFKSGNKAVTVASASTVYKVIGSLTKGKAYYVRIRTYKTVGSAKYWSEWSTKKSVKITK
ncbi:MAG: leucine-rich repeat protein [Oscillospiraceae bacterium]|nr:leucine-rich repeat protein [Oscillospiraceae bacterium]